MTYSEFLRSTHLDHPPEGLSSWLRALWYAKRGDWHTAHEIVQDKDDKAAQRIHAYLHRVEGDNWNADYWYRRAGLTRPAHDLRDEWEAITRSLIGGPN